jgi:hypothetical protein
MAKKSKTEQQNIEKLRPQKEQQITPLLLHKGQKNATTK